VKETRNEEALSALERLLSHGAFLTVEQIAAKMRCSKMVAYRRIQYLKRRGARLRTKHVRVGERGPKAVAYALLETV
jgi:predicted transcriptional regulator